MSLLIRSTSQEMRDAITLKARFRELLYDPALHWVDDPAHQYASLYRQLMSVIRDRLTWYRWLCMLVSMVATVSWTRLDLDEYSFTDRVTRLFESWPLHDAAEHTLHLLRRARPTHVPVERYARFELWFLRHSGFRYPRFLVHLQDSGGAGEADGVLSNPLDIVSRRLQRSIRCWLFRRRRCTRHRPVLFFLTMQDLLWGPQSQAALTLARHFSATRDTATLVGLVGSEDRR